jgi:hypothetical protein
MLLPQSDAAVSAVSAQVIIITISACRDGYKMRLSSHRSTKPQSIPTQPISQKRLTKAAADVIGSSSRFERKKRESGAFDSLSPQEVVQLQHTIEQYAAAMAANSGLRLRGCVQVRDAALARAEAAGRDV